MHSGDTVQLLAPGTRVDGRFVLVEMAGSGGMGVVYRGFDELAGRAVAVKVLTRASDDERARFEREADALAAIDHANAVRYVARGTTATGHPYLVMEWLEGEDLARRLSRGALPIDEAIAIAGGVAEALAAAHARGLVHRDVKPSNLFVPTRGATVKVLDFGLARPFQREHDVTSTGVMIGTPGYMSPEQARGGRVDARSDVFSLGCVLYECLAGRPAFLGSSFVDIVSAVLFEEPPRLRSIRPDVPVAVDDLVARMLAKNPGDRPADGAAVVTAVRALVTAPRDATELRREVVATRALRCDRRLAWGFLVDTNRWDRIAGAPTTTYAIESLDGGATHVRLGSAELFGLPSRWIEAGEWIEGAMGWGERRLLGGPFETMGYSVSIRDADVGCVVEAKGYVVARPGAPEGAADMVVAHFARKLEAYLAALDAFVASDPSALEPVPTNESPCAAARRKLLARPADRVLSGKPGGYDPATMEACGAELVRLAPDRDVAARVLAHLRDSPDEHLRIIRPIELARALDVDARTLLRTLLVATDVGLLDLAWEVACPTCRVAAASRPALDVDRASCAMCRVDFEVDLAGNVEAIFRLASSIRALSRDVYCGGSPAFRPHVVAHLIVAPGERRDVAIALPPEGGVVRARSARDAIGLASIEAGCRGAVVDVSGRHVDVVATERAGFTLVNRSAVDVTITFERANAGADATAGAFLLSCPELLDVFSAHSGDGATVGVSTLALLVLATSGVDEACDTLGDGPALSLAKAIEERIEDAIAANGGSIVHRHGDALVACMVDDDAAMRAFARARDALDASCAEHAAPLALHAVATRGPVLAVTRPGSIELFGRTLRRAIAAVERVPDGSIETLARDPEEALSKRSTIVRSRRNAA